jgi:hypothetical protein
MIGECWQNNDFCAQAKTTAKEKSAGILREQRYDGDI